MNEEQENIITTLINNSLKSISSCGESITVARIFSESVNDLTTSIDLNTILISHSLVNKINPAHINVVVKSEGIQTTKDYMHKPSSWMYISPSSGLKKLNLCLYLGHQEKSIRFS